MSTIRWEGQFPDQPRPVGGTGMVHWATWYLVFGQVTVDVIAPAVVFVKLGLFLPLWFVGNAVYAGYNGGQTLGRKLTGTMIVYRSEKYWERHPWYMPATTGRLLARLLAHLVDVVLWPIAIFMMLMRSDHRWFADLICRTATVRADFTPHDPEQVRSYRDDTRPRRG